MTNIQVLEKQLALAKSEKESNDLITLLGEHKLKYEGCWSTHKVCRFNYPGKGFDFNLIKFSEFQIKDKSIVCKSESIRMHIHNKNITFEISDYPYLNTFGARSYMYDRCKHKVSEEDYQKLRLQAEAYYTKGIDNIRLNFPSEDLLTMGDSSKEKNSTELLLIGGDELIDLTGYKHDYSTIAEMLSWYNHPYLIGNYLLKSSGSKKILIKIIKDLRDKARSWGSSIAARDYPRADALESFMNSIPDWK